MSLNFHRYAGTHGRQPAPVYWLGTLGFWGAVDPASAVIIDPLHPQRGLCLAGAFCLLEGTKGSTAGPGALLEWLGGSHAPAAILVREANVTLAVAAQAGRFALTLDTVLGELINAPATDALAAWNGIFGVLVDDRIERA